MDYIHPMNVVQTHRRNHRQLIVLTKKKSPGLTRPKGEHEMSEKIGFVCDSTADFPVGLAKKLRIHTLPVHIQVGEKDHLHGVSISNNDVIENMLKNKDVSTKPFYPFECADYYDRLLGKYDKIVSFHLSTELSGCYKSAVNAHKLLFSDDAERIKILDLGGWAAFRSAWDWS